jgi:hypothetical protein
MWDVVSDERASLVYNFSRPSPAQSFSGPIPVGLVTILYCPNWRLPFSSSPTTRRVTVEVFDPASTRECLLAWSRPLVYLAGVEDDLVPSIF